MRTTDTATNKLLFHFCEICEFTIKRIGEAHGHHPDEFLETYKEHERDLDWEYITHPKYGIYGNPKDMLKRLDKYFASLEADCEGAHAEEITALRGVAKLILTRPSE